MSIASSDILYKLSVTTGSAGNSTAQADPNASLGKYISTTQFVDATAGDLFADLTGDQNAAGQVDYRCVFIHNSHATLTWTAPKLWISADIAGGATVAIGLDPAAASPIGQSSAQAATIGSSTSAPSGVTFSAPTTKVGGLSVGDLPAGQCRAFWVARTGTNSAALPVDGFTWTAAGDSL